MVKKTVQQVNLSIIWGGQVSLSLVSLDCLYLWSMRDPPFSRKKKPEQTKLVSDFEILRTRRWSPVLR